jgi:WS/DGAT/MGAT family acyltransferase
MSSQRKIATEPLRLRAGEHGTPLTPVDLAWLRMDEPSNRMHVHGVLILDGDVPRDVVAAILGERFARIPRFRQRVADHWGSLEWVDDPAFDIDRHVVEQRLHAPGSDRILATAIERHLHEGLDRAHPLWVFHVLRGYQGDKTAVLARIHHAIGDGVALMMVLLAMTDQAPRAPGHGHAPAHGHAHAARRANPFLEILAGGHGAALKAARHAAEQWAPETLRLMLGPAEAYGKLGLVERALGSGLALTRILASFNEPASPFKGGLGVPKKVTWTERYALDEVKAIGKALGATVNDLLANAMAGGLRRYLSRDGSPRESLSLRCAMPVNLRLLPEMAALGNRFGLVFLDLPVGIADPLQRLEALRRNAASLKRSAEPLLVLGLLDLAGRAPETIQELLVTVFGAKATAVFSNVPGPSTTLTFAGHPLSDIFFWVPQAGRLGLGVSILSYDGRVRMGVGTDAGLVPDPERIIDGFQAELEALQRAANRA